jgi:hypothetical protein
MSNSALPANLQGKTHSDFPFGLRWIPRSWTAFKWGMPTLVFGHSSFDVVTLDAFSGEVFYHPMPIGFPGDWQISRFPEGPFFAWYFAFTTRSGGHFRIGARWDDVDNYVEFPTLAIKRNITG